MKNSLHGFINIFEEAEERPSKCERMKKIAHATRDQKWAKTLTNARKIDFKSKSIKRDKEGRYIMIKVLINQENIKFKTYTYLIQNPKLLFCFKSHL